ncbi:ENR1 protein, partial [Columbina picui]|nr:ENR1 protein [Columbina picui]
QDSKILCQNNQSNANPFKEVSDLREYWQNPGSHIEWKAPDGLFWICGNRAYNILKLGWKGTCTIRIIQLAFFLIPKEKGSYLGKPL